jgi:hypothetical protein
MPVFVKIVKNNNAESAAYGKHYGKVVSSQTMTYRELMFGDLGTFYLAVKSEGTAKEEDFNLGVNIKGLYLRFAPSRQDVNDLSSKALKKKADFMLAKDLIETKKKKEDPQP